MNDDPVTELLRTVAATGASIPGAELDKLTGMDPVHRRRIREAEQNIRKLFDSGSMGEARRLARELGDGLGEGIEVRTEPDIRTTEEVVEAIPRSGRARGSYTPSRRTGQTGRSDR